MLYLYAITDASKPPRATGLHGASVDAICVGALAAIVSEHDDLAPRVDEQAMWAHEAVVEALMLDASVLPVRFATVLDDAETVEAMLRDRGPEFRRALDRVRGAVEVGVRITIDDERSDATAVGEDSDVGPGTAYLLRRVERTCRAEEAAKRIHEPLCALALDHTRISASPRRPSLGAAYLVDAGQLDDFATAAERLQAETEGVALVVTGPWPPYSFTSTEAR